MRPAIQLNNVWKTFYVETETTGFWNSIKRLFKAKKKAKHAIKNLSFEVKKGEIVGYIGENGAGKSTTIKMLTGIFPPTKGTIKCLGFDPFEQRKEYVKNIGVVFGQRSLLYYDIPVRYSMELFSTIYDLNGKEAKKRYEGFAKRLKVKDLLDTPVRKLSLGERMKFEIIASLLHKPKIIFLDEPTIGLDLLAREEIIKFLEERNKKENTTIILTTHNMDDIEELCKRVILIDEGKKVYDGSVEELKRRFADWKLVKIDYKKELNKKKINGEIVKKKDTYVEYRIKNKDFRKNIVKIIEKYDFVDLSIEEPHLKEVVKKIYEEGIKNDWVR